MRLERWQKFSKGQQIGAIAAEITRAKFWREKDRNNFLSALERILMMIDFALDDARWRGARSMLFWLRDELAKLYCGISSDCDFDLLCKAL